jgi:hypothetical protein
LGYSVLLGMTVALLFAPSAWAATFTVDNTGDSSGQLCTGAGGDCSLRSAVSLSNASTGTTDTIDFDATVFPSGTGATIGVGSPDLVISDPVNITGGDCDPTAGVKPCVGLDNTGGTNTLTVFANGVSISGVAFTGAAGTGINALTGFSGLTVTGSWFGVGLDGTTLDPNDSGISLNGVTSATVGGSSTATRNVFADNTTEAIAIGGSGGSHTIKGNYFGALPNGTAVANPGGIGISMSGTNSGTTIGGDAGTVGQCTGECNLIVNFTSDGIRTANGGSGGPTGTTIRGNFIGLGLNGTTDLGNGGSGIDLDSSANTTIGGAATNPHGGPATTKTNYIAGNNDGGVKAQQSNNLIADNNYIGLTADGTTAISNTKSSVGTGSGLSYNGDGGEIDDNRFGGNGVTVIQTTTGGTDILGNLIGVGPAGQAFDITGEPGLDLNGGHYTIGGPLSGDGNTIGNVKTASKPAVLFEGGVDGNSVTGNFIGTTSDGTPEPNAGNGIELGVSNAVTNNVIGGSTVGEENVISNNGGDAIFQKQAGDGNRYLLNLGRNNGSTANDLFIDIGTNGPGNLGGGAPNDGITAPSSVSATSTSISGAAGSARAGATIRAYATYTNRGDLRKPLGSPAISAGDGSWTLSFPALPNGQCVTANQTDTSSNSSELSTPVAIGGGSCVTPPPSSIDSGPTNGSTIADNTPTFGFSSTEAGTTFQCKVDSGSFSTCTSSFTTAALSDGSHTFQERAVQGTPANPGLGTELGASSSRTFTVDTTGPSVTFDSGPSDGSTISTTSVTFGFTANETGSTLECKIDTGSFAACSSPFTASSLASGTHSIQVRGTDSLGNVGAPATRSFTVRTGRRAAAIKKCKKKFPKGPPRNKCIKKAKKLPV